MIFKVGVVRGGTLKEVESKKFNIYLGISLNNKWFTKDNLRKSARWDLRHTKDKFAFLIADSLQAINYMSKDNYSKNAAEKKAKKEGEKISELVNEVMSEFSVKDRERIDLIMWGDIRNDPKYKGILDFLLNQYENNLSFKEEVLKISRSFSNRLGREIKLDKLDKLGIYVVNELPEFLSGFTFAGTYYNCSIYPYDGDLFRLTEKIQKGISFPQWSDKLGNLNNVFVELRG